MENLLKELGQLQEILATNANVDWSENDPATEFSTLAENLQKIIRDNTLTDREKQCIRLSTYICDWEEKYANMDEALALLEKQAEIDGTVMADDIVMMWMPLEYRYTVDQLLEEL